VKRLILAASIMLAVAVPAAAQAKLTHRQAVAYGRAYAHVQHVMGKSAPGCKLIGRHASCHKVSDAAVLRSTQTLHRMLAPAPRVVHVSAPVASTSASASAASYGGGYSIPSYIVMCESGGDWGAVNPTSAAGGAYQILPSTWAQYGGTGLPQDASPAEQSAVAARIYADVGPSAWSCG